MQGLRMNEGFGKRLTSVWVSCIIAEVILLF